MAENQQDEPISDKDDDLLTDEAEGESEEKKKRFSKPLLIKIGIGVTVLLLIAGGAYFFLMSDEEPIDEALTEELTDTEAKSGAVAGIDDAVDALNPEGELLIGQGNATESAKEEGGETDVAKQGADASSSPAELTNAQELAQIRDDIKALQEENSRLKSQVTGEEVPSDVEEKPSGEDDVKVDEPSKVKAVRNQYSDIYQEESREYPYVRKPKQESVPQPKWGE